jgi:hypothetical protein
MKLKTTMNGPMRVKCEHLAYDKFFWFLITDLARSSLSLCNIPTSGAAGVGSAAKNVSRI